MSGNDPTFRAETNGGARNKGRLLNIKDVNARPLPRRVVAGPFTSLSRAPIPQTIQTLSSTTPVGVVSFIYRHLFNPPCRVRYDTYQSEKLNDFKTTRD